jgi:GTP1/Obg family GTP-binding protein
MKEINDSDLESIKNLIDNIDKLQSSLQKNVVHVLKGVDPAKISLKKFDEAMSIAKKVSDDIDKDIKHLRKLLR